MRGALAVDAEAEPEPSAAMTVSTTRVSKGEVVFTVSARGEIQGRSTVILTAPMTDGIEIASYDEYFDGLRRTYGTALERRYQC